MSCIETVIPVYGDDPDRKENLRSVIAHLQHGGRSEEFGHISCYPIWEEEGDSPGQARNRGAENIVSVGILFNDGDTICPWPQILQAVMMAAEAPGLVFAYDLYCRLTREMTERVRDAPVTVDGFDGEWGRMRHERPPILNSGSMGCVAISRACFEQVGGFDESYVGWGYEDLDFATRCNDLWPNRRVTGPVFHLWHGDRRNDDSPDDSDPAQVKANEARWQASTA